MKLGFIGAGDFAQAVAKRALKATHEILLSNRRGPDSVREMARQLGAGASCLLPDEKLLGRVWVLIRIAVALRRLVATTL